MVPLVELNRLSQVLHHLIDLHAIDGGVVPAATVWGLFAAAVAEHHHQVLIGPSEACQAACLIVQTLIVLDPEGNVPGLPVRPSVEGGFGCGCHGFVSTAVSMARNRTPRDGEWTVQEVAQQNPTPSESLLSYGKSDEVRGSTVDAKGRHRPCAEIKTVHHEQIRIRIKNHKTDTNSYCYASL